MKTKLEAVAALKYLRPYIKPTQLEVLGDSCRGEEKQFFFDLVCEYADRIRAMPRIYAQSKLGDQAIAYLHYFTGGSHSAYITEIDPAAEDRLAFGSSDLGYGGDLGYVSIAELLASGAELDLYWKPKTLAAIQGKVDRTPEADPAEQAAIAEFNEAKPAPEVKAEPELVTDWKKPEAAYDAKDRRWFNTTEPFLYEMLSVLPPVYAQGNGTGMLFAVGEPWKHDRNGQEILLWFRMLPAPACRMATRSEIAAEFPNASAPAEANADWNATRQAWGLVEDD